MTLKDFGKVTGIDAPHKAVRGRKYGFYKGRAGGMRLTVSGK